MLWCNVSLLHLPQALKGLRNTPQTTLMARLDSCKLVQLRLWPWLKDGDQFAFTFAFVGFGSMLV